MNFRTLKNSLKSFDFYQQLFHSITRSFSLFLGSFCLLGIGASIINQGGSNILSLNIWRIDTRSPPTPLGIILLSLIGFFLCRFSLRSFKTPLTWRTFIALLVSCQVILFINCVTFFALLHNQSIITSVPLPFTFIILLALTAILYSALKEHPTIPSTENAPRRPRNTGVTQYFGLAVGFGLIAISFPIFQMIFFGTTDYRRPVDGIVVFGARAYADGSISTALKDRMRVACELYHQGLANVLIVSGGPGDGTIHETEAMRNYALRNGVPADAIILDRTGINTQATVKATKNILHKLKAKRIIAVSHFYHLPRIKMTFQNHGLKVYTVPARQKQILSHLPYYIAREVAAFWVYWSRGLYQQANSIHSVNKVNRVKKVNCKIEPALILTKWLSAQTMISSPMSHNGNSPSWIH